MMQKFLKMTETLAHGYSSESTHQELPTNTNVTGFRRFSKIFAHILWMKVALSLEGLTYSCLQISVARVVWIYDTFENNFGIKHVLEKYLREDCL